MDGTGISSSAVGHLFGFIAGPTILILIGLFKVAYSGNVPVGRLHQAIEILEHYCLH